MFRLFGFLLSLACLLAVQAPSKAQSTRSGIISRPVARSFGLNRSWSTQVQLDRSRHTIAHVTLNVSTDVKYTTYEITYQGGGRIVISERDSDRFGDPQGPEAVKKLADDKMVAIRRAGLNPKLVVHNIPEVTLYAQTDGGVLHAIDGENGRTLWAVPVGRRGHPTMKPAVSNKHVAVVNGSNLFIFHRTNGHFLWKTPLGSSPGAGPAISETIVFVPMVDGTVEGYDLNDPSKPPWIFKSSGRALVRPTIAFNTVSWPTDRGYLYVALSRRKSIRYRLEARDEFTSPTTYRSPDLLFAAGIDGYVYCLRELTGRIVWRFSTGEEISHSPIPIRDALYVVIDSGGMYRIDIDTGDLEWWTTRVRKFLGGNKDRVYCLGDAQQLLIIDAKTGGLVDSFSIADIDLTMTNWQTDRIYVGTKSGILQCLHELQLDIPRVHLNYYDQEVAQPGEVVQREAEVDQREPDPQPAGDPFAGEDDPFGEAGGRDEDPFGGGDGGQDPFGGGRKQPDGEEDADPFGGDADPFG